MNAQWLNNYIGIPYKWGGRSRDAVDCYGLVVLIYKDKYGVELPDWAGTEFDFRDRASAIEDVVCGGDFSPKTNPCNSDFVVCYRRSAAYHIGLYYNGGVIHAADGIGSVYEPLRRFRANYNRVEYGSWKP